MKPHSSSNLTSSTSSRKPHLLLLLLPLFSFVVYYSAIDTTSASTKVSSRRLKKGKKTKEEIEEVQAEKAKQLHQDQSRGGSESFSANGNSIIISNILMIGAQKGGSTAVSSWMYKNKVCSAKNLTGEAHFFTKEQHFLDHDNRYAKGAAFWAKHYNHCIPKNRTELIMDATPNYETVPERAYETYKEYPDRLKNLKIILIMREPVGREMSRYSHMASKQYSKPDWRAWTHFVLKEGQDGKPQIQNFSEYVEATLLKDQPTELSHYAFYLRKWFELFDPKQILLLSYEEDVLQPMRAQQKIIDFLQPSYSWTPSGQFPKSNSKNSPYKIHNISCDDRDKLQKKYEPWNQELYKLLEEYKDQRPPMEDQPFPKFPLHPCVDKVET